MITRLYRFSSVVETGANAHALVIVPTGMKLDEHHFELGHAGHHYCTAYIIRHDLLGHSLCYVFCRMKRTRRVCVEGGGGVYSRQRMP